MYMMYVPLRKHRLFQGSFTFASERQIHMAYIFMEKYIIGLLLNILNMFTQPLTEMSTRSIKIMFLGSKAAASA
jgi:hypothetical protein